MSLKRFPRRMLITPPVVTITIGAVAYISWRMNLPWNNDQILAISLLFAASLIVGLIVEVVAMVKATLQFRANESVRTLGNALFMGVGYLYIFGCILWLVEGWAGR